MKRRMLIVGSLLLLAAATVSAEPAQGGPLDPCGKIHLPIGVADTVDTLKTFVEAEGNFSPGFGSYGIYFWLWDAEAGKLTAPTMDHVECQRGLDGVGYLIPWSAFSGDGVDVKTEVCQLRRDSPQGDLFVVGARAHLSNAGKSDRRVALYVALRSLGPAGWPVRELAVSTEGDALLVEGHAAIVADQPPESGGVLPTDGIGQLAAAGEMPTERQAASPHGDCSGALRFELRLAPGETKTLGLVCPVLPGRRAVGHHWDGKGHAQGDLARPNPARGGRLQPDPGLTYYRRLNAVELFAEATAYWKDLVGRVKVELPDPRWAEALAAMTGHLALCMNGGAPDVTVVNYNVFNRDGVYVANVLQKAGRFDLAARAIDYFLAHPFNGRIYPEADNPGQVLWILGEHWYFTRDRQWLTRVYPSARKLAAMIEYYRTTPGPHWVSMTGLDFGEALPPDERHELQPGRCDGQHPEYTEAFDIAGLRAAAALARAAENPAHAARFSKLADSLLARYDRQFGDRLARDYGSYSVLWPCRLYAFREGKGFEQFRGVAAQRPGGWRYFPLATAHQGLLAGNRSAGHGTIAAHLNDEQMRGWYVMDEGGDSGTGAWRYVKTAWKPDVAMPHGWAVAEFVLLLRDCLVLEDGERLRLLSGLPPEWFNHPEGMAVEDLPTHFGRCWLAYKPAGSRAALTLSGEASPPGGFLLALPETLKAVVSVDGRTVPRSQDGDYLLPRGTRRARIELAD
jgi:hypothetical protein